MAAAVPWCGPNIAPRRQWEAKCSKLQKTAFGLFNRSLADAGGNGLRNRSNLLQNLFDVSALRGGSHVTADYRPGA